MKKRIIRILAALVWLVPASAAALLALAYVPTAFGYESLIVGGGSMGGTMPAGSVALTRLVDSKAVGEGDVISYRLEGASQPTTHRVIDAREKDGRRVFITKGDANPRSDPEPVVPGTQIHVVQRVVPVAGHLVGLARSPAGGVLLFLVPMIGLTHQRRREKKRERGAGQAPEERTTLIQPPVRTGSHAPVVVAQPALPEVVVMRLPELVGVAAAAATTSQRPVATAALSKEISVIASLPDTVMSTAPPSPPPTLAGSWAFGPAPASRRSGRRAGHAAGGQ